MTDTCLVASFQDNWGNPALERLNENPIWILMKQVIMEWQWHQLDHTMQIVCTLLQTDNHVSTI